MKILGRHLGHLKKIATQSFIIRFYRVIPRWIRKNRLYLLKKISHIYFQDGRRIKRRNLPFRGNGKYHKYYDIFGIAWVIAFQKGRLFKNRVINNENTRPPSWKLKKLLLSHLLFDFIVWYLVEFRKIRRIHANLLKCAT